MGGRGGTAVGQEGLQLEMQSWPEEEKGGRGQLGRFLGCSAVLISRWRVDPRDKVTQLRNSLSPTKGPTWDSRAHETCGPTADMTEDLGDRVWSQ